MKEKWYQVDGIIYNPSRMSKKDLIRLVVKLLEKLERTGAEFNK